MYSQYLSTDLHLANALCVLSRTHLFYKKSGTLTDAYVKASPKVQRWVDVLDGIALLLVHQSSGDIVATGRTDNGNLTIHWAKNSGQTPHPHEQSYITSLLDSFKALKTPLDTMKIVIPMCRSKILNRMQKLVTAIEQTKKHNPNVIRTNPFGIATQSPEAVRLHQYLLDNKVIANLSLDQLLIIFVADVREAAQKSDADIHQLIFIAYHLTLNSHNVLVEQIPSADTYHTKKLKKLGLYFQTCVAVHVLLEAETPQRRQAFRIEHIQEPITPPIVAQSDTLQALNEWATHFSMPTVKEFTDVTNVYKHANAGHPEMASVKTSQHCELTVGLELWRRKQAKKASGSFNQWENLEKRSNNLAPFVSPIVTKGKHEKSDRIYDEYGRELCNGPQTEIGLFHASQSDVFRRGDGCKRSRSGGLYPLRTVAPASSAPDLGMLRIQ
ncbi:MAG: hypothetical protein Q9186_000056 [Xanthomendoza sp. 1 TL-2023]